MATLESPLLEVQQKSGAKVSEFDGWLQTAHYGDAAEEVRAVRNGAGLFDFSARAKFSLEGPDRALFLNNLTTNDIKALTPGAGCWAYVLDPKGKVQADMTVFCEEDRLCADAPTRLCETVRGLMDRYLIMEDVQIRDTSEDFAILSIQGPHAATALAEFLSADFEALGPFGFLKKEIDGIPSTVARIDRTGLGGYELIVPAARAAPIWKKLAGQGDITPAGVETAEILRVESGIPLTGVDLTDANIPVEAGMFDAISYTKGCYLGQEVIARLHAHGNRVSQRLMGLRIEGEAVPQPGDELFLDDKPVGCVTSAVWSPTVDGPIAMAIVRRAANAIGTKLVLRADEIEIPVEIVERSQLIGT